MLNFCNSRAWAEHIIFVAPRDLPLWGSPMCFPFQKKTSPLDCLNLSSGHATCEECSCDFLSTNSSLVIFSRRRSFSITNPRGGTCSTFFYSIDRIRFWHSLHGPCCLVSDSNWAHRSSQTQCFLPSLHSSSLFSWRAPPAKPHLTRPQRAAVPGTRGGSLPSPRLSSSGTCPPALLS